MVRPEVLSFCMLATHTSGHWPHIHVLSRSRLITFLVFFRFTPVPVFVLYWFAFCRWEKLRCKTAVRTAKNGRPSHEWSVQWTIIISYCDGFCLLMIIANFPHFFSCLFASFAFIANVTCVFRSSSSLFSSSFSGRPIILIFRYVGWTKLAYYSFGLHVKYFFFIVIHQ